MARKRQKLCFVLMPFKEELRDVYWKAIKPACDLAAYNSLRVDELKGVYNINRKIIKHIFSCDAVVADLTEWNPNVFYELGVAHAIDNKTIMIIQDKDKVPFDVHSYRCIQYEQSEPGLKQLSGEIAEALMSIEEWRKEPANPVQDFKPGDAFIPKSEVEQLQNALKARQTELEKLELKNVYLEAKIDQLRSRVDNKQPSTESVSQPPAIELRSTPLEKLSESAVKKMLKDQGFFDIRWNEDARGVQHGYEVLEKNGEKLVFDRTTGLTWQQSGAQNKMPLEVAIAHVKKLNKDKYAGFKDWRLPTLEETMSLMEPKRKGTDLYIDPIFDATQPYIWTSDKESASIAWVVGFYNGICSSYHVGSYFVRAVR